MRNNKNVRRIIILTRLFLGIIFLFSGISKLVPGFFNIIGPVWLAERLAPYGLAFFAHFVAISEAVIGALLLTQRFATLGAVMLFPMLTCILMVTISLGWQGTPYINGFLLLLNVGILLYDWAKLKFIFTDQIKPIENVSVVRSEPRIDVTWFIGMMAMIVGMLLLVKGLMTFQYLVYFGVFVMLFIPLANKWITKEQGI